MRVVPLHVKSMEYYLQLRQAACLLSLEHIDTLVTERLRGYFVSCSVLQNKYRCCPEAVCV